MMQNHDRRGPVSADDEAGREVFRQALRSVLLLLGVLTVLGTGIGWFWAHATGVWGALLGVGLAAVFSGTTVLSVGRTVGAGPVRMATVVLGMWVVKMLVVFVVLLVLYPFDFFDRPVMGAVLLAGVVGAALVDYRAVSSARLPYVDGTRDQGHEGNGPTYPSA
jgi:hypothetical protein